MEKRGVILPVGEWFLTPEGAVVHPPERTAVIADVHLGYEWARGKAGDCIPSHSLDETIARLDRLLRRFPESISTLIVAGDLVESRRPCRRTAEDVRGLRHWLERRGVRLTPLAGNHDPRDVLNDGSQRPAATTCVVAGWAIGHGHEEIPGERIISGHLHPIFRLGALTAPCFLAGGHRIVLPAFTNNAAGLDVLSPSKALRSAISNPICYVSSGDEVLDFGPLDELLSRSRGPGLFHSPIR